MMSPEEKGIPQKTHLFYDYVTKKLIGNRAEHSGSKYALNSWTVVWRVFVREFCENSSLHAISQVTKPIYHPYERVLWTTLFVLGVLGMTFTCKGSWDRYMQSSTSTVIATTRYSYANVPFPSVTICDKSRVDWPRALALGPKDIPEPYEENKELLLVLLKRLAFAAFGDFDFFDQLRLGNNTDLSRLNGINMTTILLKVMRPCDELFFEWCWFRDREYDCCHLFELQKTEFGFCWSFNSDTSEPSRSFSKGWSISGKDHWTDGSGHRRPWRTAQYGSWSGLRVKVVPLTEDRFPPDGNHTTSGVTITVTDPKAELHNGYLTVGPGQEVRLPVWGENLIATEEVRGLKFSSRRCLFPEENIYGLPQGFYLASNCVAACYQNYTLKYCGCTPDFIFHNKDDWGHTFKPCDATGMICLSEYNDIFTYEVPPIVSDFFPSGKLGINCSCPPDCTSQLYVTELATPSAGNLSLITELDVHFRLPQCIRYRTEVVFQWLDLVVSLGGIAGLFLGASLLSAAEVLYFCTVRSIFIWQRMNRRAKIWAQRVYPFLN